jgi:hypothetical protein
MDLSEQTIIDHMIRLLRYARLEGWEEAIKKGEQEAETYLAFALDAVPPFDKPYEYSYTHLQIALGRVMRLRKTKAP